MRSWLETEEGRTVEIHGTLTLGRARSSGYRVEQDDVSRRHALIHHQGGAEYWLVDLGSRNGTLLNGQRVTQPVRLRSGDTVELGGRRLVFRCDAGDGNDSVGSATRATVTVAVSRPRVEARVLLLADICGFTAMSRSMAPGELAGRVGAWLSACRDLVQGSGGTVNKYLGDGFLATWPAGGEVVERFQGLREGLVGRQREEGPWFRFVVHVGETTVDSAMVHGEETLLGPAVNYVFRMEKIAARGGLARMWSREAAEFFGERIRFEPGPESVVAGFEGVHGFLVDP